MINELIVPNVQSMTIGATKITDTIPTCYRLVITPDGNGNDIPELQGYFRWQQGSKWGGEWKSLETQVWPNISDDVPYGKLS
jgi:hypothetical protein